MTASELISIIMPAYNSSAVLSESIKSVQSQTHSNWELLITDDCSTDDTQAVIERFAREDLRIRYFRLLKNSGAAVARNTSLSHANGRFIAFLDADDLWLPEKLEWQLSFMRKEGSAFSFTGYSIILKNGSLSKKVIDSGTPQAIRYKDLLKKTCTVGCSTVMLDRTRFREIQMDNIRVGQDYALWLKLLRTSGETAHNLRIRLAAYRISRGSVSRNKLKKALRQWQIYRQLERVPLMKAFYCMFFYGKNALLRR